MVELVDAMLEVPKIYYGALLCVGFCTYYLCEVVKVSIIGMVVIIHLLPVTFRFSIFIIIDYLFIFV